MNNYRKYAPNVFVAACDDKHEKGDIITLTTKYGDEHYCEVHNFLGTARDGKNLYSITRTDGFDSQERAKRKAERLAGYQSNAASRAIAHHNSSNEGADFLRLAEPIKIGHHSEKRHRALIERNHRRMEKCVEEFKKAESYESRIAYWEEKSYEVNLSMPESIEYFEAKLEQAKAKQQGLKDGSIEREHSYSLTYATKAVKDLTKKVNMAHKLWGETNND